MPIIAPEFTGLAAMQVFLLSGERFKSSNTEFCRVAASESRLSICNVNGNADKRPRIQISSLRCAAQILSARATSLMVADQSPDFVCLNSRITTGYHGESVRS